MKRIGILSDTHGRLSVIDRILLQEERTRIDCWFHAGDYGDDARYLATKVRVPVIAVRGNTDFREPFEPLKQLVAFEDTFIYMVHGHELSHYNGIKELFFMGRSLKAKLILTGHTHRFGVFEEEGMTIVNPGSAAKPRDGEVGTYALALYKEGKFSIERREVTSKKMYF